MQTQYNVRGELCTPMTITLNASKTAESDTPCDYCGHPNSSEHPSGLNLCSLDYKPELAEEIQYHGLKHWEFDTHSKYNDPELVELAEDIRGGWTWRPDVYAAKRIRDFIDAEGGVTPRALAHFLSPNSRRLQYGLYKFCTLADEDPEHVVEVLHRNGMSANGSRAVAQSLVDDGVLQDVRGSFDPFHRVLAQVTDREASVRKWQQYAREEQLDTQWLNVYRPVDASVAAPELTNADGERFCRRTRSGAIHILRPAINKRGQDASQTLCHHHNEPDTGLPSGTATTCYLSEQELKTNDDVCSYCLNKHN